MSPSNLHLDYDPIAPQYNGRYRANPLAGVEQALVRLGQAIQAESFLEVGCGTGRWLHGLAAHFQKAQLYGLDASQGMLLQAQERHSRLGLVQGKAEQVPLPYQQFDLIFCVNALHHFDDPVGFIQQAQRLLRPAGQLAIIGQVPNDRRNRWYVYDYFEGTFERDLQRFPTWEKVTNWMVTAGFQSVRLEAVEWISDDKVGPAVLEDPFLQKEATSQLALLSDQAYMAGIAKIKAALETAKARGETMRFPAQLRLDMLAGSATKEA